jgi:hypothetical protein
MAKGCASEALKSDGLKKLKAGGARSKVGMLKTGGKAVKNRGNGWSNEENGVNFGNWYDALMGGILNEDKGVIAVLRGDRLNGLVVPPLVVIESINRCNLLG